MPAARGSVLTGEVRGAGVTGADAFARLELPLLIVAAAVIELVTVIVRIPRTGLFYDDWPLAQIAHFAGFNGVFNNLVNANPLRPLAAFWFAATSAVSTPGGYLHALWGPISHLAFIVSAFLLARALELPRFAAWALAGLILIFPFSDSNWLWYTDSSSGFALALAAAGCLVSVRSVRASGRRAVLLDLAAGALFAMTVLTYQFAAVAVLLMLIVYWRGSDRRAALRRTVIELGAIVLATLVPLAIAGSTGSSAAPTIPVSQWPDHARQLADHAGTLIANAAVPFGAPSRAVVLPIIAALLAAGAFAIRSRARSDVIGWLHWAALAAALVVAAYAVFIPTQKGFYDPLGVAAANRVNALAGVGICLLLVAVTMLVGVLLQQRLPARGWISIAAPAALLGALFVGYLIKLERDSGAWARAASAEQRELAQLWRLGRPPSSSTDYVYGGVGTQPSGVDAFQWPWELAGAVTVHWNDATLSAYPVFIGTKVECGPSGVIAVGPLPGPQFNSTAAYGRALFTDVRSGVRVPIGSRAACLTAARRLVPGPPD